MALKPLQLYGGLRGPNPFKVLIILCELDIPFEVINIQFDKTRDNSFTAINPNGRTPAIIDPNKDNLTLWESGAIINYLITEYDPDHKISYPLGSKEYHLTQQWLHFQMSGQGPYYGQFYWFHMYHPEKVPSAVERYTKECVRVTGVLNVWLADKKFLLGDKCTFADLAFYPWQNGTAAVIDLETGQPNVVRWMDAIRNRPGTAKAIQMRKDFMENNQWESTSK